MTYPRHTSQPPITITKPKSPITIHHAHHRITKILWTPPRAPSLPETLKIPQFSPILQDFILSHPRFHLSFAEPEELKQDFPPAAQQQHTRETPFSHLVIR